MTTIVGVPRETYPGEKRVALVPAVIGSLLEAGLEVVVETGAGAAAGYRDEDYVSKSANIVPGRADVFRTTGVIHARSRRQRQRQEPVKRISRSFVPTTT